MLLDVGPARGLRQVEDILHGVELMSAPALTLRATLAGCLCRSAPVNHVEVIVLALGDELGPAFLELVGDELEEDQREDDVFVFRGLDRAAKLGGGVPEGFLEGFGLFGVFAGSSFGWGHDRSLRWLKGLWQGSWSFFGNRGKRGRKGWAGREVGGNEEKSERGVEGAGMGD